MSQKTDSTENAEKVSYTLENLPSIPSISEERKGELRAMASLPDSEIDTSDIPVMTEVQWKNAPRRDLYRPVKKQITARVDADVLEWLKGKGEGYQTRLNSILRREMLAELRNKVS
jgi:uncharacterized protein (DUF4415 family)